MEKVRLSVVSYLNSKPFAYGIENSVLRKDISVTYDIPALCAEKLITNKADVGLVPVAVIPLINDAVIISDYCIAADGKVDSVLLLSNKPVKQLKRIVLDSESRTSVQLARLLAREYWNISPEWISESSESILEAEDETGAVVIGDRALKVKNQYKYCYDLAEEWYKHTSLPFVFACWVANKKINADFINAFNDSLRIGIENIENVIVEEKLNEVQAIYLRKTIVYHLNDKKREAIALFLKKIKSN